MRYLVRYADAPVLMFALLYMWCCGGLIIGCQLPHTLDKEVPLLAASSAQAQGSTHTHTPAAGHAVGRAHGRAGWLLGLHQSCRGRRLGERRHRPAQAKWKDKPGDSGAQVGKRGFSVVAAAACWLESSDQKQAAETASRQAAR
jgi:hypothetical protein